MRDRPRDTIGCLLGAFAPEEHQNYIANYIAGSGCEFASAENALDGFT